MVGVGPDKVLLGVITKGHARPLLRLLTQNSRTLLPPLHRRAPAGLVQDTGAPLVVDAHGVRLQRAYPFLMNVPCAAGEPYCPDARAVAENTAGRRVLLLCAPGLGAGHPAGGRGRIGRLFAHVVPLRGPWSRHVHRAPLYCRFFLNVLVRTAWEQRVEQYSCPFPAMKGRLHSRQSRNRGPASLNTWRALIRNASAVGMVPTGKAES